MTIEHKDLPEAGLHEPKGIEGATTGYIYMADGFAGGTWTQPTDVHITISDLNSYFTATNLRELLDELALKMGTGWGHYHDDGVTDQTINTSASKLVINKLGANTVETYLPLEIRGSANLWSTINNKITPINLGDSYEVRLDLPITGKTSTPTLLTVEMDTGIGASPTDINMSREVVINASTTNVSVSFPVYVDAAFLANGCQVFLKVDTGDITIDASSIIISRTHNGEA